MRCPQCSHEMVKAKATGFGEEYDYCRTCKKELAEMKKESPGTLYGISSGDLVKALKSVSTHDYTAYQSAPPPAASQMFYWDALTKACIPAEHYFDIGNIGRAYVACNCQSYMIPNAAVRLINTAAPSPLMLKASGTTARFYWGSSPCSGTPGGRGHYFGNHRTIIGNKVMCNCGGHIVEVKDVS